MKIDDLVERLEAVYPWTPEKVASVLGVKLTITTDDEYIVVHEASHITYEGLLIDNVHLRFGTQAMDVVRLYFDVSEKAACITRENIEMTYTGGEDDRHPRADSLDGGLLYYRVKRPWGKISFSFRYLIRPNCLADIIFIPEGK